MDIFVTNQMSFSWVDYVDSNIISFNICSVNPIVTQLFYSEKLKLFTPSQVLLNFKIGHTTMSNGFIVDPWKREIFKCEMSEKTKNDLLKSTLKICLEISQIYLIFSFNSLNKLAERYPLNFIHSWWNRSHQIIVEGHYVSRKLL